MSSMLHRKSVTPASMAGVVLELLPSVGFQLGGKYPRSRLSTTLEELVKLGEIVRAYTGVGSAPHRYKRVSEVEKG